MAQRFGGKFSPNSQTTTQQATSSTNPFDHRQPARAGTKSVLLFMAALLFVPSAFGGTPRELLLGLGATGLMLLSAWLTREGLKAEAAFEARTVARRPAFPRKIVGSVLTGMGLASGTLMSDVPAIYAILFGLVGIALHLGSFGMDPLKDKGAEGIDSFQTDRVARAVDEAEKLLSAMRDAILRARDRQLEARVDRFASTARALFRTIEQDPRDLTAARKYLSVYLLGARDATVKFADLYAQTRDPKARSDYETLLNDLETTFADRSRSLLADNKTDMNIEIEVLRERLQRET